MIRRIKGGAGAAWSENAKLSAMIAFASASFAPEL
jgi:hypothetical protein